MSVPLNPQPPETSQPPAALDRAIRKAYRRLIPLLFVCYVIAYIDRVNVGFAKLNMQKDLASARFDEGVFGFGMGIFFVGYLLLEIPGTLLVERWSARKWISRIMITWGIIAAFTAFVRTPTQFYTVRFLLGLAEAGFFPGVIVYLTHWFPTRERTRALALFLIATPISQFLGPPLSGRLMGIGVGSQPAVLGLVGWQWVFIVWGIPAVLLGLIVLRYLTDRPSEAAWLTDEERQALEAELLREKVEHESHAGHFTVRQALSNPKILILAAAYFFVVTGNYGVELYMSSILRDWYGLTANMDSMFDFRSLAWLLVIPPIGSLIGQLFIGWSSDRTRERQWHAVLPIVVGSIALALTPFSRGNVWLSLGLFTLAMTGLKGYLPAFWALPNLMMSASAAAASIGLINSFGNLGGWAGPTLVGGLKNLFDQGRIEMGLAPGVGAVNIFLDRQLHGDTGYNYGLWCLAVSMAIAALIIATLRIKRHPVAVEAGKP